MGNIPFLQKSNSLADLNGDGVISSTDAIAVINRIGDQINPNVIENELATRAILPTIDI